IGLVAGLAVGVLAGSFFAESSSNLSADRDASTACQYVGGLTEDFDPEQIGLEDPTLWRLQAVATLAQAAPAADSSYQELGDQGEELMAAVVRVDEEKMESTLQAMDQICQDL